MPPRALPRRRLQSSHTPHLVRPALPELHERMEDELRLGPAHVACAPALLGPVQRKVYNEVLFVRRPACELDLHCRARVREARRQRARPVPPASISAVQYNSQGHRKRVRLERANHVLHVLEPAEHGAKRERERARIDEAAVSHCREYPRLNPRRNGMPRTRAPG